MNKTSMLLRSPRQRLQKKQATLAAFQRSPLSRHAAANYHDINDAIEEELLPGDRLYCFHPTCPGDILDQRFKTIAKLGYGTGSTVWLAENLKFKNKRKSAIPRHVSIKIAALDTNPIWETRITKIIANAAPSHDGLAFLQTFMDEFQLQCDNGTHSCIVYTPMRETLYQLQHRLRRQRLAPPLFKFFLYCLLETVDYLHTKCRLIHTGYQGRQHHDGNENDAVLADFVKAQKKNPQPRQVRADGRAIYASMGDFGPLRGSRLFPQLTNFTLAFPRLAGDRRHLAAIQSHRFRAPEVLLGCPWPYSVDIWNLGLLMWNLLEDKSLFGRPAGDNGEYDAHVHLAQMVSLLGDPPQELIQRERSFREKQPDQPVVNPGGKACQTMNAFWGGPFFDDEGEFMCPLIPKLNQEHRHLPLQISQQAVLLRNDLVQDTKLADTVTEMSGEEKDEFLDFASGMLQWLPEKRKTARELLQHPMFDSLNAKRADCNENE